jgi:hypothetical protein
MRALRNTNNYRTIKSFAYLKFPLSRPIYVLTQLGRHFEKRFDSSPCHILGRTANGHSDMNFSPVMHDVTNGSEGYPSILGSVNVLDSDKRARTLPRTHP